MTTEITFSQLSSGTNFRVAEDHGCPGLCIYQKVGPSNAVMISEVDGEPDGPIFHWPDAHRVVVSAETPIVVRPLAQRVWQSSRA